MPILPTTPTSIYGTPVVLETETQEFTDPHFPSTAFVRLTTEIRVDIGQSDLILYSFATIFVKVGDRLVGPIPCPTTPGVGEDGGSGGGN
ncbi:hypothetical protein ACJRO7_001079 [Eucalyptus globulus]|uniref:Uncharacterized protein n=1 Tax=Eucalyptus globulus TaxID=34317 RepID=A0ABD3LZN0_EUCGL